MAFSLISIKTKTKTKTNWRGHKTDPGALDVQNKQTIKRKNCVWVRQLIGNSPQSELGRGDRLIGSCCFGSQELAFQKWVNGYRKLSKTASGHSGEFSEVWKLQELAGQ